MCLDERFMTKINFVIKMSSETHWLVISVLSGLMLTVILLYLNFIGLIIAIGGQSMKKFLSVLLVLIAMPAFSDSSSFSEAANALCQK